MGWPVGWSDLESITDLIWLDWIVDPADGGMEVCWPTPSRGSDNGGQGIGLMGGSGNRKKYFKLMEKYGSGTGIIPR